MAAKSLDCGSKRVMALSLRLGRDEVVRREERGRSDSEKAKRGLFWEMIVLEPRLRLVYLRFGGAAAAVVWDDSVEEVDGSLVSDFSKEDTDAAGADGTVTVASPASDEAAACSPYSCTCAATSFVASLSTASFIVGLISFTMVIQSIHYRI